MRKGLVVASMAAAILMVACMGASAAIPGELTLGANVGYPISWGEIELEYKSGPWAGGLHTTYVIAGIEVGIFGRYYVPLGAGFNFYAAVNPSIIFKFSTPFAVRGLIKAGPGFDYRWEHLRVALEGGIFYLFGEPLPTFYIKAGAGYRF